MTGARFFLFIAVALADTAGAVSPNPAKPLWLETTSTGEVSIVSLRGNSTAPCDARYVLEASSGKGQSNRSVHRGVARLREGPANTFITIKFADVGANNWSARLLVKSCDGSQYEEIFPSSLLVHPTPVFEQIKRFGLIVCR